MARSEVRRKETNYSGRVAAGEANATALRHQDDDYHDDDDEGIVLGQPLFGSPRRACALYCNQEPR